ncbi:uncharacterized protein CTRU02_205913 [Colletotrichum truncatum]|uniref:Uncharacterized protein n=1 Tax=Colletotrichum truncatum TaxID=5467 RepID=A0ACC3Z5E0_COLTU|nr:uncharacterized protein CTRU02_04745 [Colletotrichum truncatum]KAF6795182.1 hypothetical protein CTRU02_04745 [Colletotrichum truncatum]
MASQQGQDHDRGFREAVLGKCFVQTCTDRFGDGAHEVVRQRERDHLNQVETEAIIQGVPVNQIVTGADKNGPAAQEAPLEKRIPKMPYFRNNLTALSQRYNLYFAAYENRIFVYQPKSVSMQALPREPNLILATKPDKVAIHVSGTLDSRFHHQANHIATGFLGREEVLVSAYDDGSVFAYYIRHIAEYVDRVSLGCQSPIPVPTYFFSENVGRSAWGIAIHQKSRLIAISSNRFEITVFAFGLSRLPEAMDRRARPLDYCESSVLKRKRNWRIVIPLGDGGHNIPNIALWDDDEGFAEKAVAIDINGTVWILDIWKPGTAALKIPHRANVPGQWNFRNPMGWGIAVLPYESFLTAYSANDLLGLKESDIMNAKPPHAGRWIEVQRGLANVRKHPAELSAQRMPEPEAFGPQHMDPQWVLHTGQPALLAAILNEPPLLGLPFPQPLSLAQQPATANGDDVEDDGTAPTGGLQTAGSANPVHEDDESSEDNVVLTLAVDNAVEAGLVASDTSEEGGNDENADEDEEDDDEDDDDDTSSIDLPDFLQVVEADDDNDFIFIEEAVHAADNDPGTGAAMMQVLPPDGTCNFIKPSSKSHDLCGFQSSWLDMVYYPHDGKTYVSPTSVVGRLQFHRRDRIKNRNVVEQDSDVLEDLGSRCCILRTYEEDIEMRSINQDGGAAVFCRDPISWNHPHNALLQHSERLNMVVHVPELSLVIIGSAIGRVILLTPTRSPYGFEGNDFTVKQGYRIDWVLPTRDDDKAGRRPSRGLYGIAVGPVQEGGASGCLLRPDGAPAPSPALRRYRLMLHYRDHRILSYDIGRDERNEHLLIF